jgi:hypothetical protein
MNKFLSSSNNNDLTNGSIDIFASSLKANNLLPSRSIKTDGTGRLVTSNLLISDVTDLQNQLDLASNYLTRTGTLLHPVNSGDSLGINSIQTESGSGSITFTNDIIVDSNNQSLLNKNFSNSGFVSGFGITDNLDGTVDIAEGICYLRSSNSETASIGRYTVSAVSGISIGVNTKTYIYIAYNGGVPIISTTLSPSTIKNDENNNFELYEVVRDSTTSLHITDHKQRSVNLGRDIQKFLYDKFSANRTSGLILSELGTRNLGLTSGKVWVKLNEISISAIDTSGSDTFSYYYSDGVGGHTQISSQTQWNNTQYDDSSGTLATLTNNRYGFNDVWIESDGDLVLIFGNIDSITEIGALNADVITDLPDRLGDHAIYVGRIVFQKSAGTLSKIISAFDTNLPSSVVTSHSNLSNLSSDDHPQYASLSTRLSDEILNIDTLNLSGTNEILTSDSGQTINMKSTNMSFNVPNDEVFRFLQNDSNNCYVQIKKQTVSNNNALIFRTDGASRWQFGSFSDDNLVINNISSGNDIFEIDISTDIVTFTSDLKINNILPNSTTNVSFNTLNIDSADITSAERLIYHDASKQVKESSLGNSISLISGVLDAVQDIRTTASPSFEKVSTNGTSTSIFRSTNNVSLQVRHINSSVNSVEPTQTWYRSLTSGTAGNGIGIQNRYWIENDTGTFCNGANVEVKLTDVTTGSCESQYRIRVVSNGTLCTAIAFDGQSDNSCITSIYDLCKVDSLASLSTNNIDVNTLNIDSGNLTSAEKLLYHDASKNLKEVLLDSSLTLSSGTLSVSGSHSFTSINVDTITENTPDNGVIIDTFLMKDEKILFDSTDSLNYIQATSGNKMLFNMGASGEYEWDVSSSMRLHLDSTTTTSYNKLDITNANGLLVNKIADYSGGIVEFASKLSNSDSDGISTDKLSEYTSGNGIDIDLGNIKDSAYILNRTYANTYITEGNSGDLTLNSTSGKVIEFRNNALLALKIDATHLFSSSTYSNDLNGETLRDLQVSSTGEFGFDSSLRKHKKNIIDIGDISWFKKLKPVQYNWKKNNKLDFGLIAEDVDKIAPPQFVYKNKDDSLAGVNYKKFIVILIAENQMLRKKIETIENEVKKLTKVFMDFNKGS